MNRAYALLIPIAILFTACGKGAIGDSCKDDSDCDDTTTPPLVCEMAVDATADADGTCQEPAATTTPPV